MSEETRSCIFATRLRCASVSRLKPFGKAGQASAPPTGPASELATGPAAVLGFFGTLVLSTRHLLSSLRLVEVKLFTSVLFTDVYLGTPQNFTPVSEHVYL